MLKINDIKQKSRKVAYGIDLGTTCSLIAEDIGGKIKLFTDEEQREIMPSVVNVGADEIVVGTKAMDMPGSYRSIKRLLGHNLESAQKLSHYGFEFAYDNSDVPSLVTKGGNKNAIELSSYILQALKSRVAVTGEIDAVITVPAYFHETERQATKLAAQMAGINVLRLLNEPTSAALAYGLDSNVSGNCLVFDFGGGTFDVSVLEINKGVFEVLATKGNMELGGDDIDLCIAKWLQSKLSSSVEIAKLMKIAKSAKEELSNSDAVTINIDSNVINLTREKFNQLIRPVACDLISMCHAALKDAKLSASDLTNIICVGGSSRIPLLHSLLTDEFKLQPLCSLNPEHVVAQGAAISAATLTGNRSANNCMLLDVVPLTLGIELMDGTKAPIIERNSKIPCEYKEIFTTSEDGQTGLSIHVVQGERQLTKDCQSLAKFNLYGIPKLKAGHAKVEVKFTLDIDGLLTVSSKELTNNIETSVQIKPTYGLSTDKIKNAIENAATNADTDKKIAQLAKLRVDAKVMCEQVIAIIDNYSEHKDAAAIKERANEFLQALDGIESVAVIKDNMTALEQSINTIIEMYLSQQLSLGKEIS